MKIDPNSMQPAQIGNTASGAAEQAQQRRVEALYGGSRGERTGRAQESNSTSDRAQISDLGRQLRELAVDSPERTAHLERLSNQVQTGRYQVDAQRVSQGLIAEAMLAF